MTWRPPAPHLVNQQLTNFENANFQTMENPLIRAKTFEQKVYPLFLNCLQPMIIVKIGPG